MKKRYLVAGRIAAPIVIVGLTVYSFVTKRQRVRVIVTDGRNRILLVKGTISRGHWTLPGGGLNRNESGVDAARRELHEEIGIELPKSSFKYIRVLQKPEVKIPYVAPLYCVRIKKTALRNIRIDEREICEAKWFTRSNLPEHLSKEATAALSQPFDE